MDTNKPKVIAESSIEPKALEYIGWSWAIGAVITVVGIPLLPIIIPFYLLWYKKRYPQYHTITLTTKSLDVRIGVIFRRETNIPLDRITDATISQGPIMRNMGIYKVTIETAGQTQLKGTADIIGVTDPYGLRKKILDQRDKLLDNSAAATTAAPQVKPIIEDETKILSEIRDILKQIQKQGTK